MFNFLKNKTVKETVLEGLKEVFVEKQILLIPNDEFIKFDELNVGDYLVRYTGWCGKPRNNNHNGIFMVIENNKDLLKIKGKNGIRVILKNSSDYKDGFITRGSESMEGWYEDCFKKCKLEIFKI